MARAELPLLPLRVFFLSLRGTLVSVSLVPGTLVPEEWRSKWGLCRLFAHVVFKISTTCLCRHLWLCLDTPPGYVSFAPHSRLLPVTSAAPTLLGKISAGQAGHAWLLNEYWGWRVVELPLLGIQDALRSCVSRCQQWLPQTQPPKGPHHLCIPQSSLFPVMEKTVTDWAESDCLLGLHWGAWWDSCRKVNRSLSTLPWVQTSTNTPLSGVQTSHSPSISPDLWLELLLPRMQSSCVISLFLWVPSQGYMSPPDFLLFLPNYLCIFLIALVVQALSVCQFPVRIVSIEMYFWCVHEMRWAPSPLTPPSWSKSPHNVLLLFNC